MSVGLAALGGQKGLDQVPSHRWSDCPATHAENVHVIILDPLPGRKVIVDQGCAYAGNLVGTHRCPDAAAADCHAPLDLTRRYSAAERGDEIRIVVVRAQAMRAEIDDLVTGRAELGDQLFLQAKAAVISGHADAHLVVSCIVTRVL